MTDLVLEDLNIASKFVEHIGTIGSQHSDYTNIVKQVRENIEIYNRQSTEIQHIELARNTLDAKLKALEQIMSSDEMLKLIEMVKKLELLYKKLYQNLEELQIKHAQITIRDSLYGTYTFEDVDMLKLKEELAIVDYKLGATRYNKHRILQISKLLERVYSGQRMVNPTEEIGILCKAVGINDPGVVAECIELYNSGEFQRMIAHILQSEDGENKELASLQKLQLDNIEIFNQQFETAFAIINEKLQSGAINVRHNSAHSESVIENLRKEL